MIRCRNCGDPGHATQACQMYGPWYPEEGRTSADYAELAQKIDDLIAADILAEHRAGHPEAVAES